MTREVWVIGEGFVKGDLGESAGLYYYTTGIIAENTIARVLS
jgi:hypothetical protein